MNTHAMPNARLVCDCRARRSLTDRAAGLRRTADAGAFVTTTESVLMELIRSKDHPSFKAISNCLKETRPAEVLEYF